MHWGMKAAKQKAHMFKSSLGGRTNSLASVHGLRPAMRGNENHQQDQML